jgi:O-antigen/teichoic acid export membrane protein
MKVLAVRKDLASLRNVLRSPIARKFRGLALADSATLVVGIAQGLIIARVLGPDNYGAMALSISFAALIYTILDPRAAEFIPRFAATAKALNDVSAQRALVKLSVILDTGLAVVAGSAVALTAPWLAGSLLDGRHAVWIPLLGAALAAWLAPVASARAILITYDAVAMIGRIASLMVLMRAASIVVILVLSPSTVEVLMLLVVSAAIEGAAYETVAAYHVRREFGAGLLSARLSALRPMRGEMMKFTFYAAGSSLVGAAVKYLDVLVVGWARGPVEGGYYRLAKSVTNVLSLPSSSAQAVIYPRLATIFAQHDFVLGRATLRRFTGLIGIPLSLATFIAIPLLPMAIELLAGPDYLPAVTPARFLVAGLATSALFVILRPTFLAAGEMRGLLMLTSATAFVGTGAFIAVADPYGAAGVAVSRFLVVGLAGNLVGMLYIMRRTRLAPNPGRSR